jgi:hypothetical protein
MSTGTYAAIVAQREQDPHLLARAAAELDQRRGGREKPRQVGRPIAQKLDLATGRVIFRQCRDLLEKLRSGLVIEIFRRESLGPRGQAGDHVARE